MMKDIEVAEAANIEFELRDFPADVQDILKQRCVDRCESMKKVMKDYILETSVLIGATASDSAA